MESIERKDIHTVTQLNNRANATLDRYYSNILVVGEVSSSKKYPSGHTYFTIKDNTSEINCILFKSEYINNLYPGQQILVLGNLNIYTYKGKLQLIAKKIFNYGKGDLWLDFIKLKEKLKNEGLFDLKHKKQIKKFPKVIGIVTSTEGAVLKDICKIIERRSPNVKIIISPTTVNGKNAINNIINSIKVLNNYKYIDTIIIARGGGSVEDLEPFNNEIIAREIYKSSIPIISAIGHESDTTICDLVSDLRASTPSSAAELAVPDTKELIIQLNEYYKKIKILMINNINNNYFKIDTINKIINYNNPNNFIENYKIKIRNNYKKIFLLINNSIKIHNNKLDNYGLRIESMNPEKLLERGYSITMHNNKIIKDCNLINSNDKINIILSKNIINANIKDINERKKK